MYTYVGFYTLTDAKDIRFFLVARACQLSFANILIFRYNIRRSSYLNFQERYFFWNFIFTYVGFYTLTDTKDITYVGFHTLTPDAKDMNFFYGGDVKQVSRRRFASSVVKKHKIHTTHNNTMTKSTSSLSKAATVPTKKKRKYYAVFYFFKKFMRLRYRRVNGLIAFLLLFYDRCGCRDTRIVDVFMTLFSF
jgi:hypothetical protein